MKPNEEKKEENVTKHKMFQNKKDERKANFLF